MEAQLELSRVPEQTASFTPIHVIAVVPVSEVGMKNYSVPCEQRHVLFISVSGKVKVGVFGALDSFTGSISCFVREFALH